MYNYSIEEWIIFFLIYSFIGWVYEEIFYLLTEKKLVNRGFMHGPFLPIYGSGAIIILLSVMPFSKAPLAVFFIGGLTSTILELLTGMAMEAMFHVRYWDYTGCFLNYKGHICFRATLTWCIASVLLVNCVQIPLGDLLSKMNATFIYAVAHIFMLGFTADLAISFREAFDLRLIIDKLTADNEEIARIVSELNAKKEEIETFVKELEARKERFEASVNERKEKLEATMTEMKEKAELEFEKMRFNAEGDVEQLKMKAEANLLDLKKELDELKDKARSNLQYLKTSSSYEKIKLIFKRNKMTAAERYKKAIEQIKSIIGK